jgi:hypothetical protein
MSTSEYKQQNQKVTTQFNSAGNINIYVPETSLDRVSGLFQLSDEDNERATFSEQIKKQLERLNHTINMLTADQYRVIQSLKGESRASIAGCAGSGKTLIAVEKAIRLDKAGVRTLILCHNPKLSTYLRFLIQGTGVTIFDFTSWIWRIISQDRNVRETWTHFEEPTQEELDQAFYKLDASSNKYDAIIVDEAQDFRDGWWLVIEAALKIPYQSILYIFFDNNQSLLPYRSVHPSFKSPLFLTTNCRNAGNIYEVVRHFHPESPETSIFLANQGIIHCSSFYPGEEKIEIQNAVCEALKHLSPDKLVVLTTELDLIQNSILYDLEIEFSAKWNWRKVVKEKLSLLIRWLGGKSLTNTLATLAELELSDDDFPTDEDVKTVAAFARQLAMNSRYWTRKEVLDYPNNPPPKQSWIVTDNQLTWV